MQSKKSDTSRESTSPLRKPIFESLAANLPIPVLLLLLIPLGGFVEGQMVGPYNQRIVMLVGFNIILAVSLQLINGFSGQFSLGHAGFMAVGAYLAAYPALTYSNRLRDPGPCLLFFFALGVVCIIGGCVLLGLFLLIRYTRKMHASLPIILLIVLFIWVLLDFARASSYANRADVPTLFVWSKGLELLQQLFLWITTSGLELASRSGASFPEWLQQALSYLILVVGGGICAGVVGLVVGMPALRLRGDYLAIATLGLSEIIRIVIQNSQPLGGALGLTGIPKYTNFAWLYGAAVITTVVIWRLAYSARGRAIMAVREDEIAAATAGIDPRGKK